MTTSTRALESAPTALSRLIQLALAGLVGAFVIGFAGFAHLEAAHNAAHDYRHSVAFPCH
jgi:cobalt transporter subunit CbtB